MCEPCVYLPSVCLLLFRVYTAFPLSTICGELQDADLSDYFNTIPQGPLMRCLSRRIADGSVLSVVKLWLRVPVVERHGRSEQRTTVAADTNRGTPQGSPASPLLANLYFRRFVLAWKQFGHEQRLQA
ncbi:MAG: hypothetical protein C0467_32920, partial [Planctomycetaceae bacterium]|nr:hypothetical protein [Planctomycetaceae bacterium]